MEDEESLRELTSRILTRHGYQRLRSPPVAATPSQRASDPAQAIDLLLTDVIMPEMLGNEVAAAVRAARPDLPALYMSGYAQPILDSHGMEGVHRHPGKAVHRDEPARPGPTRPSARRPPSSADGLGGTGRALRREPLGALS